MMNKISVRDNCYFTDSAIADLVFILIRIFKNEELPSSFQSVYTAEYINIIRERHRFLGEIFSSLETNGFEMLEFLLCNKNYNNPDEYKAFVTSLDDEEYFYIFFGRYVDKTLIRKALQKDEYLNEMYSKYSFISSSYLALKSLFLNKKLFLQEFFSCLEELNTNEFKKEYEKMSELIYTNLNEVERALELKEPLAFSESIMGKTFRNRGPYEEFIFIPSYLIPIKAIRYFGRNQILIYQPKRDELNRNDIIKILKILSDDTRFQIIELLSKNKSMKGKDIASAVKLTTPTISHHIEQLKEAGFIHEERVKNSKYYSVNSIAVSKFVDYLSKTLKENDK